MGNENNCMTVSKQERGLEGPMIVDNLRPKEDNQRERQRQRQRDKDRKVL